MVLLTFATVTFDDPLGFERTARSILPLLNEDIHWIIKDGGSNASVIQSMQQYISSPFVTFSSASDFGIYDAMNYCLEHSYGNWLVFINGGDEFMSDNLDYLTCLLKTLSHYEQIIVCGGTIVIDKNSFSRVSWPRNLSSCSGCNSYRMSAFHQSQVYSIASYKSVCFDLTSKVSADHAYFWQSVASGASIVLFREIISTFYYDGVSSRKPLLSALDNWTTFRRIQKLNLFFAILSFSKKLFIELVFYISRFRCSSLISFRL